MCFLIISDVFKNLQTWAELVNLQCVWEAFRLIGILIVMKFCLSKWQSCNVTQIEVTVDFLERPMFVSEYTSIAILTVCFSVELSTILRFVLCLFDWNICLFRWQLRFWCVMCVLAAVTFWTIALFNKAVAVVLLAFRFISCTACFMYLIYFWVICLATTIVCPLL